MRYIWVAVLSLCVATGCDGQDDARISPHNPPLVTLSARRHSQKGCRQQRSGCASSTANSWASA